MVLEKEIGILNTCRPMIQGELQFEPLRSI